MRRVSGKLAPKRLLQWDVRSNTLSVVVLLAHGLEWAQWPLICEWLPRYSLFLKQILKTMYFSSVSSILSGSLLVSTARCSTSCEL